MTAAKNVIPFRSRFRGTRPSPGTGTVEFVQATLDAHAFLAACVAGWNKRTLNSLAKNLSPLATEIVLWARDEMAAAKLERKQNLLQQESL